MTEAATGRSAVVADGRPLQRNLLRFLLEQEGYKVVSEAATGSAAAEMAGRYRPDVVVLHETLALESPDVVRLIRRASPTATVVILTADRTTMPSELTEAADASIEEGAGLRELAFVVSAGGDEPRGGWSPQPAPS